MNNKNVVDPSTGSDRIASTTRLLEYDRAGDEDMTTACLEVAMQLMLAAVESRDG